VSTSWGSLVRAQYRPYKNPPETAGFFVARRHGTQCVESAMERKWKSFFSWQAVPVLVVYRAGWS
jgi:hypothetical protein